MARMGIVLTFQGTRLFAGLSVLENVRAAAHLRFPSSMLDAVLGTRRLHCIEAETQATALEMLGLVGLEGQAERRAGDLPYATHPGARHEATFADAGRAGGRNGRDGNAATARADRAVLSLDAGTTLLLSGLKEALMTWLSCSRGWPIGTYLLTDLQQVIISPRPREDIFKRKRFIGLASNVRDDQAVGVAVVFIGRSLM